MRRHVFLIVIFLSFLTLSCSAPSVSRRTQAARMVDTLNHQEASDYLPQEYQNLLETYEQGEATHFVLKKDRKANEFYQLALQKASILGENLRLLREQSIAEAAAARAEEERLVREAEETAERQRLLKQRKIAGNTAIVRTLKTIEHREPVIPQPTRYTVRRGETLPQIAARNEIYNDSSLWPLIYRANRDQIRDPKHLWPGQTLKIPRNFTREQALEAQDYSNKKR